MIALLALGCTLTGSQPTPSSVISVIDCPKCNVACPSGTRCVCGKCVPACTQCGASCRNVSLPNGVCNVKLACVARGKAPPSCGRSCKCGASCTNALTGLKGICQKSGLCSTTNLRPNCGRTLAPTPGRKLSPTPAPSRGLRIPVLVPASAPTPCFCGQSCSLAGIAGFCNANSVCVEASPSPAWCPPSPTPGAYCTGCGSTCSQFSGEAGVCNWNFQCIPVTDYQPWCPPTPAPTAHCPTLKCGYVSCAPPRALETPTEANGCKGCPICSPVECPAGECLPCCPLSKVNTPLPCRKCPT